MHCNIKHTLTFMQWIRIHIQPPTLHLSYNYWLKIHEVHTQSKGEDWSTALARPVVSIYYWVLEPVMCAQPRSPLSSLFKTYDF